MPLFTRLSALLHRLTHRAEVEADLQDELRSYADELTDQKIRQGMSYNDARRTALIEIGGIEQVKEACRDSWSFHWLESVAADIRYGFRSLTRSPAFFLTVVLTLGPGLGLNTALFSIFDAYFLRPLSVQDPGSLYEIVWRFRAGHERRFTLADMDSLSHRTQTFSDILAIRNFPTRIEGNPFFGQLVSGNYFTALGVGVVQGRPLLPHDSAATTVLSYDVWKSRFGGDPRILGRKIYLRGHPVEVVGVATPAFTGLGNLTVDFWAPLDLAPVLFDHEPKDMAPLSVVGRLRPGVSQEQSLAALDVWATQMTPDQPEPDHVFLVSQATKLSLKMEFKKPAPFFIVFGLIILMACANVSNMMLARALGRQREIGVRISLGAPRSRLIRQLLTESLLLALPSAIAGLAISAMTLSIVRRAILATVPPDFAFFFRIPDWSLDLPVAGYVILAGFGSAFIVGLIPALQVTRTNLTLTSRGDLHTSHLRNILVVGQVTVCVLLLISTTVILRGRQAMVGEKLGFEAHGVFDIRVPDHLRADVAERFRQNLPGVEQAAAWRFPLYGRLRTISVTPSANGITFSAGYNFVSPEYFSLLKISIVAGRNFTPGEAHAEAPLVIVSNATARLFWPNQSPLGQSLQIARIEADGLADRSEKQPAYSTATVVGVAGDVVSGLVGDGVDHTSIYFPIDLQTHGASLMLRTTAGTGALPLAKAALESVAPEAAEYLVPMDDVVVAQLYPFRLVLWICSGLAGLALLLSATGIYGVLTYLVSQRAQEFGIRMAMGATSGDLMRSVLSQSLRLAGWGTALGVLLAAAIAPLFAHQLEALNPYDGFAYATGALLSLGVSLAAAFIPSHRASSADPALSLRCD